LHNKDKCILLQFVKWLNLPKECIKHYNQFVRLDLSGDVWQQNWAHLGLVRNKTYNPSILSVPNNYLKPFLIGLIDADGSISFHKKSHSISLINHPQNIDWFTDAIKSLGFNGNINSQIVNNKWKRIRIQRKQDVIDLANLLEINKYSFILDRKWKELKSQINIG
jgi:hypothetical protein